MTKADTPLQLESSDFAPSRSLPKRIMHKVTETPGKLRLAGLSAWRGKERGLAVIAGVFLASLVITTVLSYGVGLSQLFFEESLKNEPFDAKIEFARTPVENSTGWSNNTSTMTSVCDELMEEFTEFSEFSHQFITNIGHSGCVVRPAGGIFYRSSSKFDFRIERFILERFFKEKL